MPYDVAIVGAGYVGLPLAVTFAEADCKVLVVDVVDPVVAAINDGTSHIEDVADDRLGPLVQAGLIRATTDYAEMKEADAILIALPTPLSRQREPDLTIVESATRGVAEVLQHGQTVVLESTTWPGTTREVLKPILEQGSGLKAGEDFYLAMSPERVDPGREDYTTKTTPKVLGGLDHVDDQHLAVGLGEGDGEGEAHVPRADDCDVVWHQASLASSKTAIRSEAWPSPYRRGGSSGKRAAASAAASCSGSTSRFPPAATVSTHSVFGRSVTHGTPSQYASFCRPPESVTTRVAPATRASISR